MQGLAVCGADCYCEASTVCMYLLLLSSLDLMCLLTTDSRALLRTSLSIAPASILCMVYVCSEHCLVGFPVGHKISPVNNNLCTCQCADLSCFNVSNVPSAVVS